MSKPATGAATREALCNDLTEIIRNRSDELIASVGYQPEMAKFDCLITMKIIVDQLCDEFNVGQARKQWYREMLRAGVLPEK